jgi:putative NADPH-quinone reductase
VTNVTAIGSGNAVNFTLPSSGTYTILVHALNYDVTSTYDLSVQSVIGGGCNSRVITCGQTVTTNTSLNAEIDALRYTGNAGQIMSIGFFWSSAPGVDYGTADIYSPSGQWVTNVTAIGGGNAVNFTLPSSGTYTILVHALNYDVTSTYDLSVQSVIGGGCNADSIFCGQTVNGQISQASQMIGYEMVANAGEHVIFSDGGFSGMVVDIYNPTGNHVVNMGASTSTNYIFANTGIYTVVVHDGGYTATGSFGLTLTVFGGCSSLPTDSILPTNQAVPIGSSATFTAVASGSTPLFYQWWFGTNLITGATNATFSIANVQTNELGLYEVYVNNPGGAVSNTVRLQAIPIITWTNPAPIIYGAALTSNQLNATASVLGNFVYTPASGTVLNAGTNVLSAIFTPTDTVDYTSVTNTVSLVVSNASLTITATNRSKIYGQMISFSGTEFTTIGLVNGDTVSSASIASAGAPPTAPVSGSPYVISVTNGLGDAGLTNYNITYVSGSLTVNPAALSVTATGPGKTYGTALTTSASTSNFTATGMQNSETVTSVTLTPNAAGLSATTAAGAAYVVTPSAAAGTINANNYTITYNAYNGTVTTAPLTVTANNQSKTYGQTVVFGSGSSLFTTSGLQNSETIGTVTLAVSGSGGGAAAAVSGSPYTITPSAATGGTFTTGNYTITYAIGLLTVSPAPLTITASAQSKIYGQVVAFGSGSTLFGSSGLLNGDTIGTVTLAVSGNGGAATALVSGSPYTITPSAATGGTFTAGNYTITYATGLLTVAPAALTVTANNRTKTYVQTVTFAGTEFTSAGLVNGDTVTSVTLTSSGAAVTATVAGSPYSIVPSAAVGTGLANYTITYVNGTLTVTLLVPVVTWTNPVPIIYGTALTSIQLNATSNVLGIFAYTPTNGSVLNAGTNILSAIFTPTDTVDYTSVTNTVSLVVSNAPLTITATNRSKIYGQTISLSGTEFTTIGLVNGDAVSSASIASAGAPPTAPVSGSPYVISITNALGDAGLTNYNITYVSGSLTVNPAALSVTATGPGKTYGTALTTGASTSNFTATGMQNSETVTSVTLTPNAAGFSATTAAGAAYVVTPSAVAGTINANNYSITYNAYNGTVATAPLMVTATGPGKTYGTALTTGASTSNFTATGMQNSETVTSVTLTPNAAGLSATTAAGVAYVVTPSAAAGTINANNYTITYNAYNSTVTKAPLTVTANNQSKTYGQTLNLGTTAFTTTLLSNSDAVTSVTLSSPGAAASATVAGSPYTITASAPVGTGLANYSISYLPGSLTVTAVPLTVTANNTNRPYGAANPVFTGTIVGLTNGDYITESFSCSATSTSPAGPYAIIPILVDPNGRLVNYSPITTNDGVLTVTSAIVLTAPSWLGNGQFKLSFNTTAGLNYTVQYSTDLSHWTSLVELGGDGSPLTVTDFSGRDSYRFYRVISP